MNNPHNRLDVVRALSPQDITAAATYTGATFDTKGAREYLLAIVTGAFTVNRLTVANLQYFSSDENDMGSEAQLGSSLDIFASIAANSIIFVRVRTEEGKKFGRFKIVTTGAATTLLIAAEAIASDVPMKAANYSGSAGSLLTLAGTIQAA